MKDLLTSITFRTLAAIGAAVALTVGSIGTATAADPPDRSFYFGIYGGGNLVLDDWDLNANTNSLNSPKSSAMPSFKLGGHVAQWLAIEGTIGVLPYESDDGTRNNAMNYNGSFIIEPVKAVVTPYLALGGGAYHNVDGTHGGDIDFNAHYGLGLNSQLANWLGLRVEAKHVMTDGKDEGGSDAIDIANNVEVSAGLDFYMFSSDDEDEFADRDGDGILDSGDSCPTEYGMASANGCPDDDGDGTADSADRCPDTFGPKATEGCPDSDNDGVLDMNDKCPGTPGSAELDGCLDSDNDGVWDSKDECPTLSGSADMNGCPDSDGDGVADKNDACPDKPGPEMGVACPEMEAEVRYQFIGKIEGVHFATAKAALRPDSHTVLDTTAASIKIALAENPNMILEIQGHTDSRGKDSYNMDLSQRRAESVRTYLIEQGIPAQNLVAKGYGETMPTASNDSADGRALNRRVEIKLLEGGMNPQM